MVEGVHVGIIGFGIVGGGTYQALTKNAESIARRAGGPVTVTRICDTDWQRTREIEAPEALRTTDIDAIIDAPDVHVVVETIGGINPALDFVTRAIENGKSVVTSNKELIAKHGADLLALAARHGVDLQFEGSVGGVIPVIRALKESLEADNITEVIGIVNGTTNYILTRMTEDDMAYGDALAEAQRLGYAEADPTNDVAGIDSTYKISILSAIAFGLHVSVDDIYREGIAMLSPLDIAYADRMGYVIKLLAISRRSGGNEIECRVHPALLSKKHPLAAVTGSFNAVFVRGDGCDEVMLYGRGAGALPTGVAVAGDVVDCARNILHGASGRVLCTCTDTARVMNMGEINTSSYVRMRVKDKPGVLGSIAMVFGTEGVSLASVHQEATDGDVAEIVWVTHESRESALNAALHTIGDLPIVESIAARLRVVE